MAIAATTLISEITETPAVSYTTAAFAITSGRPIVVGVISAEPTLSIAPTVQASEHGATYTFTQEGSVETTTGSVRRRVTLFSALPTSTTTDTLTVIRDLSQAVWAVHVWEFTGADNTDIIRQAVTGAGAGFGTVSITLAAFGQASNGTFGFWVLNNTTATLTVGSGFTSQSTSSVFAVTPTRVLGEFRTDNDTGVDMTISGTVNRAWAGIAFELKESPASNTITAVTATGTGTAIVPQLGVAMSSVIATGTGAAIVAGLPVSLTPVGRLGLGQSLLGNIVLGEPGGPSGQLISGVVATGTGTALVPLLAVAVAPPAASGTDETVEPTISVNITVAAVAKGSGTALVPGLNVVLTSAQASGTGLAFVPSITSSGSILAVAASGLGSAPIPTVTVRLSGTTATGTGTALAHTLSVDLSSVPATGEGTALVPEVGGLEVAVSGDLDLRAILHERLVLDTVISETLNLRPIIHERCKLEASMKQVTSGQAVTYTGTFEVDDVRTDPTTITLQVREPDGTTTEYTYLNATITKDGTGVFSKDIVHDVEGTWKAKMVGTGTCRASDIESVIVRQDPFS